MITYLETLDRTPPAERWPLVRNWLLNESLPFFAELRANRPILVLPELTLATRYADCATILRRHDAFGVDLYKPKQGDYWMAQDDTATHWRDKSVMRAILDREDIPAMRAFIAKHSAAILRDANGSIEAVNQLTRAVPIALVQEFFGFANSNPKRLFEWSYWNQQDAFHNQPFDAIAVDDPEHIVAQRKRAGFCMALYLGRLVAKRAIAVKFGSKAQDPVSRLLRLSFSKSVKFNLKQVLFNVGGLLIGAVETTSHAAINALEWLLADPLLLASARQAAAADDPTLFDGHVFEALRFKPAFPYFFRTCHTPTTLAGGTAHATVIAPGTTILAVTHSAMFDPAVFPDPDRFDPTRSLWDTFTFGQGLHECLGRAVGAVMIPEIVRQCLLLPDLQAQGPAAFKGGVPETYALRWKQSAGRPN